MLAVKCLAAFLSGCFVWLAVDTMVAIWVKREPSWTATIVGTGLMGISFVLWRISH